LREGLLERGVLGDEDFFKQNSDSLSLGLLHMHANPQEVRFEWAPDFGQSGRRSNPMVNSVLRGEIEFYRRSTHKETERYREGKNPEIMGVLRVLNKASRYNLQIVGASLKEFHDIVSTFLSTRRSPSTFNSAYVPGRLRLLVKQMIMSSANPEITRQWLEEFQVYEVLKKSDVAYGAIADLRHAEELVGQFPKGIRFDRYRRVTADRVFYIPDGAIFEGTTLYGGERPPVMVFPSRLGDSKIVRTVAKLWQDFLKQGDEGNADTFAEKLTEVLHEYANEIAPDNRVIEPLGSQQSCQVDCRDYSLLGSVILSHAGIPSIVTSEQNYTKVLVTIAGSKYLLDVHTGSASEDVTYRPDYVQNYWVPDDANVMKSGEEPVVAYFRASLRDVHRALAATDVEAVLKSHPKLIGEFRTYVDSALRAKSVAVAVLLESYQPWLGEDYTKFLRYRDAHFDKWLQSLRSAKGSDVARAPLLELGSELVHLPETEASLKFLDAFFEEFVKARRKSGAAVHTLDESQLLNSIAAWKQDDYRAAVYAMLLGSGFRYDSHYFEDGRLLDEMRKPRLALLPYARRRWQRDGSRFFASQRAQPYLEMKDSKVILELMKYDEVVQVALGGGGEEDNKKPQVLAFWRQIFAAAESESSAAAPLSETLKKLLPQVDFFDPSVSAPLFEAYSGSPSRLFEWIGPEIGRELFRSGAFVFAQTDVTQTFELLLHIVKTYPELGDKDLAQLTTGTYSTLAHLAVATQRGEVTFSDYERFASAHWRYPGFGFDRGLIKFLATVNPEYFSRLPLARFEPVIFRKNVPLLEVVHNLRYVMPHPDFASLGFSALSRNQVDLVISRFLMKPHEKWLDALLFSFGKASSPPMPPILRYMIEHMKSEMPARAGLTQKLSPSFKRKWKRLLAISDEQTLNVSSSTSSPRASARSRAGTLGESLCQKHLRQIAQ
jgi:hypothetical protein